jgi:hypothetical protein
MAENVTIEVEGFDRMKILFKEYEKEANRALKSSLRKSAKVTQKAQAASLPPSISVLKSVIKVVAVKKELLVLAGVFARGKQYVNSRGIKWNPWNLIYWLNYGTYGGRMPGHKFITSRKSKTSSRKGGIQGQGFMDAATERSMPQAQTVFEKDVEQGLDKILKKYAI